MRYLKLLDQVLPGYTEKFLAGQFGLEEMPLLETIGKQFSYELQSAQLDSVYIIACQHLLQPQLKMFKQFIDLGIKASHIIILPKIYSANLGIINELKQLGCKVEESALEFKVEESFDSFHRQECKKLITFCHEQIPADSKLIVLDDGGILLDEFSNTELNRYFKGGIYGVEQTNSGKNILLKKNNPFVITSVASSVEKIEIETNYIIRHSLEQIEQYLVSGKVSQDAKILVLGRGPIGRTLIGSLLKSGYHCDSYDIADGKFKVKLGVYDVIIGASGSNSLQTNQLAFLKDGCSLISISSSDREFPAVHIRRSSIFGSSVHDNFHYKEKGIRLINGGFPITFKGRRFECFPLEMDVTMMKLSEAIFLHILNKAEVDCSVNILYGNKRFASLFNWPIVGYFALLFLIFAYKQIVLGPSPQLEFFIQLGPWLGAPILAMFSVPVVWLILYYRKIRLYIVKKT